MGVPGPHHTSILSIPLAYIWVNYSYSLTWHVGPFWLDSSYWPWFQWGRTGFGRYNLPRYIILGFAHVIQHFSHHSHRVQFLKMRNSTCPLAGTFTVIVRKPVTGPSWRKARWFAEHLFPHVPLKISVLPLSFGKTTANHLMSCSHWQNIPRCSMYAIFIYIYTQKKQM
jgi:hypothetical protein